MGRQVVPAAYEDHRSGWAIAGDRRAVGLLAFTDGIGGSLDLPDILAALGVHAEQIAPVARPRPGRAVDYRHVQPALVEQSRRPVLPHDLELAVVGLDVALPQFLSVKVACQQLARSKRFIYNVGTQVPFIVRIPKKWQHLAPVPPGNATDRRVNFVDLPKTVISMAGLPVPESMQGTIFLGLDAEPPQRTVHFFRDRMAERPDFSRAVTDGRWYFIRNFMPHRPRGRDSRYGFNVQANWRAWERHYDTGRCDPIQSQFFLPKPPVEFFDTQHDSWHVTNLAAHPEYQEHRKRLEKDLEDWMVQTRDLGLVPEPMFFELAGPDKPFKTRYEFGQSDSFPVEHLLAVAKQASMAQAGSEKECLRFLQDDHPVARYWGAYGLFLVKNPESEIRNALEAMVVSDGLTANRILAAQALGVCGNPDVAFEILFKEACDTKNGNAFLFALNALQYSGTDSRLTKEDWTAFQNKCAGEKAQSDAHGYEYAERIIQDALNLWPERRQVV